MMCWIILRAPVLMFLLLGTWWRRRFRLFRPADFMHLVLCPVFQPVAPVAEAFVLLQDRAGRLQLLTRPENRAGGEWKYVEKRITDAFTFEIIHYLFTCFNDYCRPKEDIIVFACVCVFVFLCICIFVYLSAAKISLKPLNKFEWSTKMALTQ